MYIIVILTSLCPSNSCTVRIGILNAIVPLCYRCSHQRLERDEAEADLDGLVHLRYGRRGNSIRAPHQPPPVHGVELMQEDDGVEVGEHLCRSALVPEYLPTAWTRASKAEFA